jgi:transcription elongation factor Elf1
MKKCKTKHTCPKCGNKQFEKWPKEDPMGTSIMAQCKKCEWIWTIEVFY